MNIIELTNNNFEKEVLNSNVPVLVDFWASWCMPCKMMAPVVEEIANIKAAEIKVGKVNVDQEPELASKYGIMSIPTFLVFKNGKNVNMTVGVQDKEEILNLL